MAHQVAEYLAAGMDGYISKPIVVTDSDRGAEELGAAQPRDEAAA